MGIKTRLGGNSEVKYAQGYLIPPKQEVSGENWQADSINDKTAIQKYIKAMREEKKRLKIELFDLPANEDAIRLQKEAIELAKECDEVIFIGGLNHEFDIEGEDRPYMKLPYHQDELIEKLLDINPNTTIVMISGSPVEMNWANKTKALVWSYYSGMETGNAIADILFGNINPSGKLAETMPISYKDTPTGRNGQFGVDEQVTYDEGVMVGYRYFDKFDIKPNFCFGHGLSYTSYEYNDLNVDVCEKTDEISVKIEFMLKNIGDLAGAEVVQVYVGDIEASVDRPLKELKAYKKVMLQPGESKKTEIVLDKKAFGFYHINQESFYVEPGVFNIYVNSSSEDCRLKQEIMIQTAYRYQ